MAIGSVTSAPCVTLAMLRAAAVDPPRIAVAHLPIGRAAAALRQPATQSKVVPRGRLQR